MRKGLAQDGKTGITRIGVAVETEIEMRVVWGYLGAWGGDTEGVKGTRTGVRPWRGRQLRRARLLEKNCAAEQ